MELRRAMSISHQLVETATDTRTWYNRVQALRVAKGTLELTQQRKWHYDCIPFHDEVTTWTYYDADMGLEIVD